MKIALDAVGGDHGLTPNIDGAVQAANAFGVELVLVGPAERIRAELSSRGIGAGDPRFEVVDAPDLIAMDEEPAAACRAKPRSSIMVCGELVAAGRAAGLVSAGHSGATMAAVTLWHLKRIPGVLRPAIAVPIPTAKGVTILLDAGANVDCKPWHLVQFATMGVLLARHAYGIEKPTVGLLTIGEEEGKGNELVKEAFVQLKASGLDFAGAVEGRDVPAGKTDVVVCDGFVGNVVVKTMEGTAAAVVNLLKAELTGSWRYKLPSLTLRGPFSRMKKKMNPDEYGGAPLVGVNGVVIICHGSSNARAIAQAVRAAARAAESGLVAALHGALSSDAAQETARL
ncbi:MAG TPA: phosphate acyltransferase PlsX [Elusimicrobiota bacterium]|nr:phosphate acyltransferase PlsX [Elusimicrobiota bacterium]